MKRFISILLLLSILLFSCVINVSALDINMLQDVSTVETKVLAEVEKAFEEYRQKLNLNYSYVLDTYCHFKNEETIDYVYVNWCCGGGSDAIVGDRYLDYCVQSLQVFYPTIGLYIYDVADQKIYTFAEAQVSVDNYLKDFLDNHSNEISENYIVYKCGDMDLDGRITIIDAALIQRALAGIDNFPPYDESYDVYSSVNEQETFYVSDFNYDGKRNIFDAIAIQKKLIKLY